MKKIILLFLALFSFTAYAQEQDPETVLGLKNAYLNYYSPSGEDGMYSRLVKAAFYDTGNTGMTILYVCVGALEIGDDPDLTNHIAIAIPNALIGDTIDIKEPNVVVAFYNMVPQSYFGATSGRICVEKSEKGYNVYCACYDEDDDLYFGTISRGRAWMDRTEKKVYPNQIKVYYIASDEHSQYDDLEEIPINSVFVNDLNPEEYVFYFATQEGVTSEEAMLNLDGEPAAILRAPKKYFHDWIYGYSVLYNEHYEDISHVGITFRGVDYTPENVHGANVNGGTFIAQGANFHGMLNMEEDHVTHLEDFEFFLSAAAALNGRCIDVHFTGDPNSTAYLGIPSVTIASESPIYNLLGQRVKPNFHGIFIVNGKKVVR